MASTGVTRIEGIDPSVAIKAPCVVATTVNITLSGSQVIDGITVDDTTVPTRVLVRAQTNATENGVYEVSTATWKRAEDFDGNRDIVDGTLVTITVGATYAGVTFRVTTADPVVINVSDITFATTSTLSSSEGLASFSTVAELKLQSLAVGQLAKTKGYYTLGDGGCSEYLVFPPQVFDGYGDHELANGNIAVLQVKEVAFAQQFGAKATPTVDTLALQAFLDYLTANPKGGDLGGLTYLTDIIYIGANTTLRNGSIASIDALSNSLPVLLNTNWAAVGSTIDDNIILEDVAFTSTDPVDRNNALVAFNKCTNLTLNRVTINDNLYQGLAIGGCVDVYVDDVQISGCGKNAVTSEGGPGIWLGPAPDGADSRNVYINRPIIRDCEWAGIYTTAQNVHIINPIIEDVKEGGIFGDADGLNILGGRIDRITRKFISGAGIEIGGDDISIGGGLTISTTDNVSVSFTDTQNFTINGLTTKNARRDATTFPDAGHVSILSSSAFPDMPWRGTITGHTAYDTSSPSNSAVQVVGSGAGSLCVDLGVNGNDYEGTAWTAKAIDIDVAYWGTNCVHENNLGVSSVSADRGDSDVALVSGIDETTQRFNTTLTALRNITISTTGAYKNARFKIVRTGLGAFGLNVNGLKTIPSSTAASVDVVYDGAAWVLEGYGPL